MKKVSIMILSVLSVLLLTACIDKTEQVTIIDFYDMDYGDVVRWGYDNDISIKPSSAYTDEVSPNHVFAQSIEAGTKVDVETEITISYSRGYDPEGEVVVPDFTDKTEEDVREWLTANDISKYNFYNTYSTDILANGFVRYEIVKTGEHDGTLRKDTYNFYFSKGEIIIEDINFSNRNGVRGVNLGGWFVLEGWMTPELFEGVDGSDETAFLQQKPNAETELVDHWNTFITEDDFKWLSDHGVDYVRLPIPWWLFGVENAYEGTEYEVDYLASITYIDRAMVWAEDYGIDVLLDLHTAPGCQNGFDNGGIAGLLEWPKQENVDLTLVVMDEIASHFSQYDSLWGIEVLNEPGWGVDMNILQGYYLDSYDIIRQYNPDIWVGFHDGFRSYMDWEWKPFFNDNEFTKVFLDVHLYHVFGDWTDFDLDDHLEWVAVENYKHIQRYDGVVPVVIGEWSLALPGAVFEGFDTTSNRAALTAFANKQLNTYELGMGSFFWSYKIDRDSHKEWDFVRMVEQGYFPQNFSTK